MVCNSWVGAFTKKNVDILYKKKLDKNNKIQIRPLANRKITVLDI
jgi:hypothetical protein